jgi:hypothetical protein
MRIRHSLLASAAALVAVGCGGGGGGVSPAPGGGAGSGNVPVFATDAPNVDFDHVWVKIYSVDLVSSGGTTQNVFQNSSGLVLDVRSLRDNTGGRFQFLDSAGVPVGTYASAKVELDKNVTITRHGSGTDETDHLDGTQGAPPGHAVYTFNFNPALNVTASSPLVLDFDLANWSVDNTGRVHAVVKHGDGSGLGDGHRHEHSEFEGVVSGLGGGVGAQTFTLQHESHTLSVVTDSNTVFSNADGSPNPNLANGERVGVKGTWSNGVFTAKEVRIFHAGGEDSGASEAEGTFSNVDASGADFDVTVFHANFVPAQPTLHVTTDANTKFFSDGGVLLTPADFFALLNSAPAGSKVQLHGTASGQGFAASAVKVEVEGGSGGEGEPHAVAVGGLASNVSADTSSFTLTAERWEGLELHPGTVVNVVTTDGTKYRANDVDLSKADWYAALTPTSHVYAFGTYSNGVLTAQKLLIAKQQSQGDKRN